MKKLLFFVIFLLPFCCEAQSLGAERVKRVKEATVQILLDGEGAGTGFFLTKKGYLVTCWHVIESAYEIKQNSLNPVKEITVKFHTGELVAVSLDIKIAGSSFNEMVIYDFATLKLKSIPKTPISTLRVGKFDTVSEGDDILTSGFPFGISQNVISRGILSTKWAQAYRLKNSSGEEFTYYRNVAWLDLTMNKGNSGGAIVLIGDTPEEDRVIGIATFILNPLAQDAQALVDFFSQRRSGMTIGGLQINDVYGFLGTTVINNSLGISGLMSIDYLIGAIEK